MPPAATLDGTRHFLEAERDDPAARPHRRAAQEGHPAPAGPRRRRLGGHGRPRRRRALSGAAVVRLGRRGAAVRHPRRQPHRPQSGGHRPGPARHRPDPGRRARGGQRPGGHARGPARGGRRGLRGQDRLRPPPAHHPLPVLPRRPRPHPGLAGSERTARPRPDARR
ncbi:hypothetical protein SGPA1_40791 [Streptomyces misionensis JCM 4497]